MARKKFLDDIEDQQENRGGLKGFQNKNHLSSSPPRTGSVLGLVHRGRTNQKLNHHANNNGGQPVTAEESLYSVMKQLSNDGLTIREMPGDGNCLFRALSDQLEGNTRNHVLHRRAVVQFMRENRSDFEPFVEDDQPFDKYVQGLSQPGTFAGNDAIVAFARLHNVTVVIHQLNSPAWLIHPSTTTEGHCLSSGREVHIAYHNGDHYNSVRKIGDDSDSPSDIRFVAEEKPPNSKSTMPSHFTKLSTTNTTYHSSSKSSTVTSEQPRPSSPSYPSDLLFSGNRDEDFWIKDNNDIDRLVEDVLQQTGYPDPVFVRDTLLEFNFDMVSTIDFILSFIMSQSEAETESPLPQPTPVAEGPLVKKEVEALAHESGKVLLDLDTGIGISKGSENTGEVVSSADPSQVEAKKSEPAALETEVQHNLNGTDSKDFPSPRPPLRWDSQESSANSDDAENVSLDDEQSQFSGQGVCSRNDIKPRLSTRQRNEMKKKERKAHSNRQKKSNASSRSENSPPPPSAQYSSPGFRSLNI